MKKNIKKNFSKLLKLFKQVQKKKVSYTFSYKEANFSE